MNIIFGTDLARQVQHRHTVLELDTFNLVPTHELVTAYCLIDSIPLEEMFSVNNLKDLHSTLIAEYKKRNWKYCEDAIAHLNDKWQGELNSFYAEIYQRIQTLKQQDLPDSWNGQIDKTVGVF